MLALIHIPKTAGTTLHKILIHKFRPGQVLAPRDGILRQPDRDRLRSGDPPRVRLVMGHVGVELAELVPGVRCVTVLRDPVARVVSHYHYARNTPGHYLHERIHRDGLGLIDYVQGDWSHELRNGMLRMLAGMRDSADDEADDEKLAMAVRNLDRHFVLAGLTERFDETVLLLARLLGWEQAPYFVRRRVGSYRGAERTLDDRTREAIEEANHYDRRLYEHVVKNFDEQLATRLPDHADAVARFRRRNASLGRPVFCARELAVHCGIRPWF